MLRLFDSPPMIGLSSAPTATPNFAVGRGHPSTRWRNIRRSAHLGPGPQEYVAAGEWSRAADIYSQALAQRDTPNLRILLGHACTRSRRRWEEAVREYAHVTSAPASHGRIWYEQAVAQLARHDIDSYRQSCADVLAAHDDSKDSSSAEQIAWTWSLRSHGDADWGRLIALAALPGAEDMDGSSASGTLGAILARAGLLEDARAQLIKARDDTRQNVAEIAGLYAVSIGYHGPASRRLGGG